MEQAEEMGSELFLRVARRVKRLDQLERILEIQENRFDFRPYGVDKLTADKAVNIYGQLEHKYAVKRGAKSGRKGKTNFSFWYESEKKLYVWFMLLYTHFHKQQLLSATAPSLNEYHIDFQLVSRVFFNKCAIVLQFHFLNLFRHSEKISWNEQQDRLLLQAMAAGNSQHSEGLKWSEVSRKLFTDSYRTLFRSPKHCRERWLNHLDFSKVHGNWSELEDYTIFQFVVEREGKRWSKLVSLLNDKRTEHMIKNRYNSLISRNRLQRHDREKDIAQRTLNELRQLLGKQQIYVSKAKTCRRKTKTILPAKKQDSEQEQMEMKDCQSQRDEFDEQGEYQEGNSFISNQPESMQEERDSQEIMPSFKQENRSNEAIQIKQEEPEHFDLFSYEPEPKLERIEVEIPQQSEEQELQCENFFPFAQQEQRALHRDREEQGNNIYPFENYSYEYEIMNYNTQMYEFHKNQLLYYQQFLGLQSLSVVETQMNTYELIKALREQSATTQTYRKDKE